MKKLIHIILLLLLIFCASCKKDKVALIEENETCDCTPIPEISGQNFGYEYINDSIYFLFPQFNPNDDNEILFVQYSSSFGEKMMYKYNLISKQKTLIYEGAMNYAANWGKQDWILFDRGDFQIWKMKSNGDSITQVTSNGAYFHPEWNSNGTEFISYHGFVNVEDYYVGTVWNANGTIVDTFSYSSTAGDWKHQEYYAGVGSHLISIINPHTNEVLNSINSNNAVAFNGFDWISNNEGIFTTNEGIFKLNVWSGQKNLLICSCDSKIYSQGCTNSNATKIIYSETVFTPIDANTLRARRNLVIMNTDGTGFERLDVIP